ncbi:ABC-type uncharacterized transport system ATPase component [Dysgonomonas hofstadii]|uniref:ABC-type uncharacterized transport system ATPase component n=1 Tax=Dysgonomonas hofstadii TaxID=637886 RepID=A0A840CVM6_9BACT|nr:AAA family ATPase [Dysgonomonas hofstadii]MBB4036532.1 ABC-type uncharacterized transport system ATPase component [Dysgonomonas hofstadii]
MDIKINQPYIIIKEVELYNLPNFIVITGENGTGKTQFLTHLYESVNPMMGMPHTMIDSVGNATTIYNAEIISENKTATNIIYRMIDTPYVDLGNHYDKNSLITKGQDIAYKLLFYINHINLFSDQNINLGMLNKRYLEVIGVRKSNQDYVDKKVTFPAFSQSDIDIIKKIIDLHPSPDLYLVPYYYIAYQPIPSSTLFSANLKFLYIQYWARKKANLELNEAPWITFNKIAQIAQFRYHLETPDIESEGFNFEIKLIDRDSNTTLNADFLSSGEKVIFSLILAIYSSNTGAQFPDVILFDEPDAYLHPTMSKQMLDVIQNVLVKENNIKVIMTTHSPTTVALTPELNLYRMHRELGYIIKSSKKEAIKTLTNGLNSISVYYENIKQIFVEAPIDKFYLENIYTIIQNQFENYLTNDIILQFITAGSSAEEDGCDKVKNIVNTLTKAKNTTTFGVIDWDLKNNGNERILVLGNKNRYAVDNYIFDPIAFVMFILSENNEKEKVGFNEEDTIINFYNKSQHDIQTIVNNVISKLEDNYPNKNENLEIVKYEVINGMEFYLPKWFTIIRGHDLEKLYIQTFSFLNKHKNLSIQMFDKSYRLYPSFIHKDILETLQELQRLDN